MPGANGLNAGEMRSRVLVIFPGALGDLLCLAPALSVLARRHHSAALELMAREELAHFAAGRLGVSRGHSIDRREVALLFRESGGDRRTRAFFGEFEKIYCFFNVDDPDFRDALCEAAAPGGVAFHRFCPDGNGHVVELYLKEIDGESRLPAPRINLLPEDLESAVSALRGVVEPGRFVAIFPGSGSPSKNWPPERFVELAGKLPSDKRPLFVLGPAEAEIRALIGRAMAPMLENLSLGTVAAVSRLACAFVGVDSGASHLASSAGCPGVVLFGSTDPERWAPLGRVRIVRRAPSADIEPDEVIAALEGLEGVPG